MDEAEETHSEEHGRCTIIVNSSRQSAKEPNHSPAQTRDIKQKVLLVLKNVSVEPVCFIIALALFSEMLIIQNLTLYKICHVDLKFSPDVCRHLNDPANHDQQAEVQAIASTFMIYKSIVEHVIPFFSSLYMGAWSDRYGRRWLLLLMIGGLLLDEVGHLVNSIWLDNPKEYILLFSSVPYSLGGGFVALRVSVFSYIADVSTPETRTLRLALVDAAFCFAGPLGNLLGGFLFKRFDFPGVFVVTIILTVLAGILTLVFMRSDSHVKGGGERTELEATTCKTLFAVKHVGESVQACLRPRDSEKRTLIWLQFFVILLSSVCGSGMPPPCLIIR